MSTLDISKRLDGITGTVIRPDDSGYDDARTVFPGGIDRRPSLIVRVADDEDVRRVVGLARESGLELAVRSGGHSGAGHGVTEGGIVLDLRDLKTLDIDAASRVAWAETGLTASEYTNATGAVGLATGLGDTGSVGIGGIALGGGVGFLVRKYGMTIDNLLAADIVTADGALLQIDADSHPDLFWAIRGGGGNFGVVTRMRLALHPVDRIVGGMLFQPATPEVIERFVAEAAAAPDELSTIANVMTAPPMPFLPEELVGSAILMSFLVYAGEEEAGQRAVAPFRALAEPIADFVRPMSYPEMYMAEPEGQHPTAASWTGFADHIGPDDARHILERLAVPAGMLRVVQLRALGGAMARVPADETAFAHRSRPIMANVALIYGTPGDRDASEDWVRATAELVAQGEPAAYVNFLVDEGEERVRQAYPGDTWSRLRRIKTAYDPTNLFRLNQNIPPA